jgi:hypothetical protein
MNALCWRWLAAVVARGGVFAGAAAAAGAEVGGCSLA